MKSYKAVPEIGQVMLSPWTFAAIARKTCNLLTVAVAPACAAFLLGALSLPALGQSVGLVGGVTHDADSGKPVAEAQIIAHNVEKGTDYATVTGITGIFTFTNLEPGAYEVAATKNGFKRSSMHVEVVARQTVRVDLSLQSGTESRSTTAKSDNQPLTEREKQLLDRIDRLEGRLAAIESRDASPVQADAKAPAGGGGPLIASLNTVAGLPPAAPLPRAPQALDQASGQTPPQSGGGRS
jgi:hypothetical protein